MDCNNVIDVNMNNVNKRLDGFSDFDIIAFDSYAGKGIARVTDVLSGWFDYAFGHEKSEDHLWVYDNLRDEIENIRPATIEERIRLNRAIVEDCIQRLLKVPKYVDYADFPSMSNDYKSRESKVEEYERDFNAVIPALVSLKNDMTTIARTDMKVNIKNDY